MTQTGHGRRPLGRARVNAPAARRLAAGALLVAALGACAPAAHEGEHPAAVEPAAAESFVRGTILPGDNLRLRSCGQEGSLPLRPIDLFTRNLLDEMTSAGEPVYAEFMGRIGGRVPTMTLTRLIHAALETRGCEGPAPDYELRAQGNEPFWSVEIRGNTAMWTTPEDLEGSEFEIASRERVGNGWLIDASAGDTRLGISFAGTPCRDSMADAWFGFTVQLELGDIEYRGCGRSGNDGE